MTKQIILIIITVLGIIVTDIVVLIKCIQSYAGATCPCSSALRRAHYSLAGAILTKRIMFILTLIVLIKRTCINNCSHHSHWQRSTVHIHPELRSGYLPMLLGVTSSALFTCRCYNDKTTYSNYNHISSHHSLWYSFTNYIHPELHWGYLPVLLGVTSSALFTCRLFNDTTNNASCNINNSQFSLAKSQ